MEFELRYVDFNATKYQVIKAIERVLHGPDLYDPQDPKTKGRVPNFEVKLNESKVGGVGNDGTGTVIVPTRRLGEQLLRWLREDKNAIRVLGKKIKLYPSRRAVNKNIKQKLEKALYIGPEKEEERDDIVYKLGKRLRIAKVQFGVWYQPSSPQASRSFSVEYERDYSKRSAGFLELVYDHKLLQLQLGEPFTEEQCFNVVVKFSSIRKMGYGHDFGNAFICFDLYTPPTIVEGNFNNRPREGIQRGYKKDRDRVPAIDEAHARVAPYAHHPRVTLTDSEATQEFARLCHIAKCEPRPIPVQPIDTSARGFYSRSQLFNVQRWTKTMDWKCAFQIEALLCNGLLNTADLLTGLKGPIDHMRAQYGVRANEILHSFGVALRLLERGDTPRKCFERVCAQQVDIEPVYLPPGNFLCHHVIVTPTRLILDGPNVTQSNRIIRHFQEHDPALTEYFVRVEMKDEDRRSYKWDWDIDGTWFLQQRIGTLLKQGFELGGRNFEFLAYSNSALREHAVWFVSPFHDPVEGLVTAEDIRRSIGNFTGTLLKQPSKYAARLAQAFTATDPSVKITRDQWEEMPDLGPKGYIDPMDESVTTNDFHTDGAGTISSELRDRIWDMLCSVRPDKGRNSVKPDAFQIRFLGYKGVVVVDNRLSGIKMRLRPSMRKFLAHDHIQSASIEIARAFERPNNCFLNRPIVMVLEDRGVDKSAFIDLQEKVKEAIYTSSDSLLNFRSLLQNNGLGYGFHLPFILEQLSKLDLDFKPGGLKRAIDHPFMNRLVRYAMNAVLRDVKHRARISVPNSYLLVGVADEGQAYVQEGIPADNVFTLKVGQIAACVQESPNEPARWLKGLCVISRSPVVHPGDLQRVEAVEPPKDKICFFRDLKNVVVLPAVGDRSLASCLGGGDLDGDLFDIIHENHKLLPTMSVAPAKYEGVGTRTLDRDSTVEDICDFVVEYINSDVLGLLSVKLLIMADQSADGTFDTRCCETLARLCSQAVDYPKNGIPVDLDTERLPANLIPFKPDWNKPEDDDPRDTDYYESDRALGHLFRNIQLQKLDPAALAPAPAAPRLTRTGALADPISRALAPLVQRGLPAPADALQAGTGTGPASDLSARLFAHYARAVRMVRATHTLSDAAAAVLAEEELVVGAILAASSDGRWRRDRTQSMRLHVDVVVKDVGRRLLPRAEGDGDESPEDEEARVRGGLERAWEAWAWSLRHVGEEGMHSFSLVALWVVLDCLKRLDLMPAPFVVDENVG